MTRLTPDVSETSANRAVARVAKQQVGVGRQASGPTVHRHALPHAVGTLSHFRSAGQVEPEVVCDEQIDAPVTVVVDERATGPPSRRAGREARGARDVLERAVPAIVIQHVLSVVGHREVDEAVVVVVAGTDARRPPHGVQPGSGGDVREGAVAVVVIEVRPRRAPGRVGLHLSCALLQADTAQHERVGPAVVVVVDEGDACAVGLDDEPLAIHAAIDRRRVKPRAIGNVDERDGPCAGLASHGLQQRERHDGVQDLVHTRSGTRKNTRGHGSKDTEDQEFKRRGFV